MKRKNMIFSRIPIKLLWFAFLLFGTAAEIFAAEGDLDPSFDGDGIVVTDNGSGEETIIDLAIQPDGKMIAVGRSPVGSPSTQRAVIVRYNLDGSIDSTFGSDGKVIIQSIVPAKLTLQPNGKIIVIGFLPLPVSGEVLNGDFYVARLNADGSFDATFNGTGAVTLDLRGTSDVASSVKVQADGKIIVGGTAAVSIERNDYAVVRFNADGSLDTTFDGDGKVFTSIAPPPQSRQERLAEILVQADGKILATGGAHIFPPEGLPFLDVFLAVRYNANGSLDATFDSDGIVFTRIGTNDASVGSATLQSDGKILVVGTGRSNQMSQIALVRYNADGSLDSFFGTGGKALISLTPFRASATDVEIQSDNKIVIAVIAGGFGGTSYSAVARLTADGSLDVSFSSDGRNIIFLTPAAAHSVAIQPNGKILIGGHIGINSAQDFMLARFEASSSAVRRETAADFDGDGKSDLSVYRDGTTWLINPSGASNPNSFYGMSFGLSTDKLTPADFDGDGKTDVAVWRENVSGSPAYFYILRSSTNSVLVSQFGQTGDDPKVVGDWDGDGKADLAVYRNGANAGEQSFFFYRPSDTPTVDFVPVYWGTAGDEATRGDFDGDGRTDAAVFRASDGIWYVLRSSDNQAQYARWGLATDKRVAGDFDGDGRTDFTVFRDGVWYVFQSSNNLPRYVSWGLSSDWLVAGDYDGDGLTDFAVWREGVYYILRNSDAQVTYRLFGLSTDIPVASAFIR